MKHTYLFLLLLIAGHSFTSKAQKSGAVSTSPPLENEAPVTAFADSISNVFQYLDKSRITSGILDEYGLQLTDHTPFTGTAPLNDANQLDIGRWRALYADMYTARINDNAASMGSLSGINLLIEAYARDKYIELPIMHFDYQQVRPDALSNGRIRSVNHRLYDVAGQNPYQTATVFAVAATQWKLPTASTSFIFRSNMFWTNTGRTVASLQADFADGNGYVGMTWNAPRSVSYNSAGNKDVRVRVTYTDGSTWECHLAVVSPLPVAQARYNLVGVDSILIAAQKPWPAGTNNFGSAMVTIEYGGGANNDGVLDKPLIVVKGIDYSRELPMVGHYYYKHWTLGVNSTGPNGNNGVLSEGLDNVDNYDVVFVDFTNGADYIQRNARVLEEVIRYVNGRTGNAPIKMIAQSMGGLVAQYTLSQIEHEAGNVAFPHHVNLLITHDSPHRGANVPLSVQMAVRQLAGTNIQLRFGIINANLALADLMPELEQARKALLSPAAQQMLRYQTVRLPGFGGYNGPLIAAPTSLFDVFQDEYHSMALPLGSAAEPLRIVANSCGTECGKAQPFGPYGELVRVDMSPTWNLPFLTGMAINTFTGMPTLHFVGSYALKANIRFNALPDHQALEICKMEVTVEKRGSLFGLFDLTIRLINYHGYSRSDQLPLDSGSGSITSINSFQQGGGGSASAIPPGVLRATQFCFLPTYSALNIIPSGTAALTAPYSPGTNVGSPYINFRTAARENLEHIQYGDLASTWMLQELRQTPQALNCFAFCQALPPINGPVLACGAGNIYTVTNLPPNSTVTWQAITSLPVSLSTMSGPTTSLTYNGAASAGGGTIIMQATISSPCGQFKVERTINAGGIMTLTPSVSSVYSNAVFFTVSLDQTNMNTSPPIWQVLYTPTIGLPRLLAFTYESTQIPYTRIRVKSNGLPSDGYIDVRCSGVDACGYIVEAPRATVVVESPPSSNRTVESSATIYPNPAHESVDVHINNADATQPITVRIFDSYGKLRMEKTGAGQETQRLSTDKLPTGLYFVHILRGAEVLSRQQLRIEK